MGIDPKTQEVRTRLLQRGLKSEEISVRLTSGYIRVIFKQTVPLERRLAVAEIVAQECMVELQAFGTHSEINHVETVNWGVPGLYLKTRGLRQEVASVEEAQQKARAYYQQVLQEREENLRERERYLQKKAQPPDQPALWPH